MATRTSTRSKAQEALAIARTFGDKAGRSRVYLPDEEGKQRLLWEGA